MQQILLAILFLLSLYFSAEFTTKVIGAVVNRKSTDTYAGIIAIVLWTLFYYFNKQ